MAKIAIEASRQAGKILMSFYKKGIKPSFKGDGSPITLADQISNQSISDKLSSTQFPIISEEAIEIAFESEYYWLVDPLDGTKDFLAENNEFTINIALIRKSSPVIGVVYAPALDELYVGIKGEVTWMEKNGIRTIPGKIPKSEELKMATSRFHDHHDAQLFAEINQVKQLVPIGSALKYGRLAFGAVDIYPRLVGTSEWDTAAGQAVLEAAGGKIMDWHTGKPMAYGKTNRRNGRFIAIRGAYEYAEFIYKEFKPELFI